MIVQIITSDLHPCYLLLSPFMIYLFDMFLLRGITYLSLNQLKAAISYMNANFVIFVLFLRRWFLFIVLEDFNVWFTTIYYCSLYALLLLLRSSSTSYCPHITVLVRRKTQPNKKVLLKLSSPSPPPPRIVQVVIYPLEEHRKCRVFIR